MAWRRIFALLAFVAGTSACTTQAQTQRPLTYVAIGASDAVGVGAKEPETEGWVPRLGTRPLIITGAAIAMLHRSRSTRRH